MDLYAYWARIFFNWTFLYNFYFRFIEYSIALASSSNTKKIDVTRSVYSTHCLIEVTLRKRSWARPLCHLMNPPPNGKRTFLNWYKTRSKNMVSQCLVGMWFKASISKLSYIFLLWRDRFGYNISVIFKIYLVRITVNFR